MPATITDLGTLAGYVISAAGAGINDAGQVVGYSPTSGAFNVSPTYHAFLYSGGVMTDLGTLAGSYSVRRTGRGPDADDRRQ
jgi:probable HAF family extracellular repeat protein